jgi:signal peptidase I
VAFFASLLVLSGSGHLVLGRGRRGAAFALLATACWVLVPVLRLWAMSLAIAVNLVAAFDAGLTPRGLARRPAAGKVCLALALIAAVSYGVRRQYRSSVVEAFKLPSRSMAPTLASGDHFFVNKMAYGLRTRPGGTVLWRRPGPARGDLIVFHAPPREGEAAHPGTGPEGPAFVKRVVGVAGDRVEVRGGELFINGVTARLPSAAMPCVLPASAAAEGDDGREGGPLTCHTEELSGRSYLTAHLPDAIRDRGATTVPDGQVYVLGDNRDNSHDSRFFGPVPVDMVVGRAMVRWWSSARPRRLGTRLD